MYHTKLFVLCMMSSVALSCATSFFPNSLSITQGSASTQALTALQTYDQTGSEDNWDDYVEFYGHPKNFEGTFDFDVSSVNPADVTSYTLNVNFKGPKKTAQEWQFAFVTAAGTVSAGNNAAARNWKWSNLTFDGTDFVSLVNGNHVQLKFSSLSAVDNCDIDFLELAVETAGAVGGAEPTDAPTQAPTQAPTASADNNGHGNGQNTPKPTKAATSKPTKAATSKPTKAPTSAPTSKPTKAATSAPTKKPTSAPTSKPSKAPGTTAPTSAPTSAPSTGGSPPVLGSGRVCAAGTRYVPGPQTTWQWQLTGKIDTTVDAQMYDIDMFDSAQSLINTLHAAGRAVTCYIDTAYEPGRPDSSSFTAAVLGSGIDGWPGQKWVDIRSTVVRNIMVNRIQMAASKGCDAVEMDDVDSYQNNPGFPITAADQLDFNSFLATTAHANDLGIALKNDVDQVKSLVSDFDFAINEQCHQYDECGDYSNFIDQNKAVFGVEYDLATSQFCTDSNNDKFSFLKKDLNLDASITMCCPTCVGTHQCVATSTASNALVQKIDMESTPASSAAQVAGSIFAVVIALFAVLF